MYKTGLAGTSMRTFYGNGAHTKFTLKSGLNWSCNHCWLLYVFDNNGLYDFGFCGTRVAPVKLAGDFTTTKTQSSSNSAYAQNTVITWTWSFVSQSSVSISFIGKTDELTALTGTWS